MRWPGKCIVLPGCSDRRIRAGRADSSTGQHCSCSRVSRLEQHLWPTRDDMNSSCSSCQGKLTKRTRGSVLVFLVVRGRAGHVAAIIIITWRSRHIRNEVLRSAARHAASALSVATRGRPRRPLTKSHTGGWTVGRWVGLIYKLVNTVQ
jgi:hypothetical protein